MLHFPRTVLFALLFCLSANAFSQNILISQTTPTGFTVCNSTQFTVSVANNEPTVLASATAEIQLPVGGIYLPGSIAGATELNISNPEKPIFNLGNIASGALKTFTFSVAAGCPLVQKIDAGEKFSNKITIAWPGGTKQFTSPNYIIETPLLVVASTTGTNLFGKLGDMLTRTITIKNTRNGPLSSFTFLDSHPADGFSVSVNVGSVQTNSDTLLKVNFGATDFEKIGDGDPFFEENETITITEKLTITACGFNPNKSISKLNFSWGCGADVCQTVEIQAVLNFFKADINPELVFTPQYSMVEDYCGNATHEQFLTIKNVGKGAARNTEITFIPGLDEVFTYGGLDSISFKIDSAGVKKNVHFLDSKPENLDGCPQIPALKFAKISIPNIAPGDSLRVRFGFRICDEFCGRAPLRWLFVPTVFPNCPENAPGKTLDSVLVGPKKGQFPLVFGKTCFGKALTDGDVFPVDFEVQSTILKDSVGIFRASFQMPCGAKWSGAPLKMNGESPSKTGSDLVGSTKIQWFEYQMPFLSDTVRGTANFEWDCSAACLPDKCIHLFSNGLCPNACDFDPDSLPAAQLIVAAEILLDPDVLPGCGVSRCENLTLHFACSDSCQTTPTGFVNHDFSFQRINFGRADNDDDRLPDAAGNIDFSKIRRDRFMPGDTSEIVLKSAVHSASPGGTFDNFLLKIFFESHTADDKIDGGKPANLDQKDDIREVFNQLEIFDQSSGQKFSCHLPAPDLVFGVNQQIATLNVNVATCFDTLNSIASLHFSHDISVAKLVAAGCPVPPNFQFSEGDSVKLTARHTFIRPPTYLFPVIFHMRVKTFASVFNGYEPSNLALNNNAPPQDFSCDCHFKKFQITGFWPSQSLVKFYAGPCKLVEKPMQERFEMFLSADNFFPFEFRSVAKIVSWKNLPEAPVVLVSQKIDTLKYQDGAVILQNTDLPFSQIGDTAVFDLQNLPLLDEGFSILLHQKFDVPCSLDDLRKHESTIQFEWQNPLPMLPNPDGFTTLSQIEPLLNDTFGFIPARPFFFASSQNLTVTTSTDFGIWSINFITANAESAKNAFIYFQNASGQLTDLEILNPAGQPVPLENGIFQLGNIPGDAVLNYQIRVKNASCDDQVLTMFYGWDCSKFTEKNAQACSKKTLTLILKVQDARLELDILNPAAPAMLCDTAEFHGANVASVLDGPAFDVRLEISLPPGLAILPGSCQISYPVGSPFQNIPDPVAISSFGRGWKLENLVPSLAATGLLPFQNAPANSASIRFKTTTACGFISGSVILYKTTAKENCGGVANTLVRPGEAIQITGAPPPDGVNIAISSSVPQPISCGDTTVLSLSFAGNAASGQRDSVFVILPKGVIFIQNSYQPGANAPAGQPNLQIFQGKNILKWKQKTGVPANSSVVMSLKLTGFGSQPCGILDTIFVKTTAQQSAVCVADGSVCDAQAITGQAFLTLQSAKTNFELIDFDIDFDAGIPAFHVKIKNNSTFLHTTPTFLNFYFDKDGSGTVTLGDELKFKQPIFFPIGPNDTIDLAAGLPLDLSLFCHLIVALDASEMCICQNISIQVDKITRTISPKIVCSGAFINLGVFPTPGHQYLWTPATNLECDTCSTPKFLFENHETEPMIFNYNFLETSGDCFVKSEIEVTVLPMPRILNADTAICLGEKILLKTTQAVDYEWFGSGISNPKLPEQTVSPIATSLYFVKIKDAAGCEVLDTLKIEVKPTPFAAIGPDTLGVCGNSELQFNAFFNPNFQYSWSPASFLSNPNVHDPKFIGTISQNLILKTSIAGSDCFDFDTVFVGFSQNPTISSNLTSLVSCFGDTATVVLSGAQQYFWAPSAGVFCQNPKCNLVGLDPAANTTYLVVGYNNFGCADSLKIEVVVPGAVKKTEEKREICAGEIFQFSGQNFSKSGKYCATFLQASGCDSIHCVDLTVLDTFKTMEEMLLCPGVSIDFGGQKIDQPGIYCATFGSAAGCDSTHCLILESKPGLVVDTFFRVLVAEGEAWQVSEIPLGFSKYEWSAAGIGLDFLSCTNCANPKITPKNAPDSLTYFVNVENADGCTAKITYRIRFLPPCSPENVQIPTAFTPNGDGNNDIFRVVKNEGFEKFGTLRVFDRWGELVFSSSDPVKNGWDGAGKRGRELPSDTFIYILEVVCPLENGRKVGDITLLR